MSRLQMRHRLPSYTPPPRPPQIDRATLREIIALARATGNPRLLPLLAGGSPAIPIGPPSSSTGGSSGSSQTGQQPGFTPPRGPSVNTPVPQGANIFYPVGGADNTAAFQSFLNSTALSVGAIAPSAPWFVQGNTLEVPAVSRLMGVNGRSCQIIVQGNGDLFRLGGGDIEISQLYVEAESPQASGAAFDCSHGFTANAKIHDVTLGSNFFNGFNVVGGAGEVAGVDLSKVLFSAIATGVKKYGNALIVSGSSTRRCTALTLEDVRSVAATAADCPNAMLINNTDTLQANICLFQTGLNGVTVGNADASALKTTNLALSQVVCDSMSTRGYNLAHLLGAELTGCHGQTCGLGALIETEVSGLTVLGGRFYHNQTHGIQIEPSVTNALHNSIIGVHILDNGESGAGSGLVFRPASGGFIVALNAIGNTFGAGGAKQQVGLFVEKGKSKSILAIGNRIMANTIANIINEAEGTEAENDVKIPAALNMVT